MSDIKWCADGYGRSGGSTGRLIKGPCLLGAAGNSSGDGEGASDGWAYEACWCRCEMTCCKEGGEGGDLSAMYGGQRDGGGCYVDGASRVVWCSEDVSEPGPLDSQARADDAFCRDLAAEEARYVWSMLVLLMIIACCCCLPMVALASQRRAREEELERREEYMLQQMFLAQQHRRMVEEARRSGHRHGQAPWVAHTHAHAPPVEEVEGLTSLDEYEHLRWPKADPQGGEEPAFGGGGGGGAGEGKDADRERGADD